MKHAKTLSFTMIEILVVATIIGILAAISSTSYSQFSKQSRDARRKADIEQIRAAVEMYRSNNDSYPLSGSDLTIDCSSTDFQDAGGVMYMSKVPLDPKCPAQKYFYESLDGSTYTIAATLEGSSVCTSPPAAGSCTVDCNYCFGPYGQQ